MSDQNNPQQGNGGKPPQQQPQPEPAKAPAVQPQAPQVPETDFQLLAKIMLQREARQALKEQQEEGAKAARDKQRDINAQSHYADANQTQANCRHLKGGRTRRATQAKDFAVYIHTYINAERVIKCQLCNAKWKIRDTK